MRKSSKKRFWRIVLFAALALMFLFFDLTVLAWVFGAFVIIPLIAGGVIWGISAYNPK